MNEQENGMKFSNGLTDQHDDEIDNLIMDISSISLRIEDLGRHRSFSVAVTKLDEARHWLRDRKSRPA